MIFVDSNIPMYLVGAAHANKQRVISVAAQLVGSRDELVTSAEVFQEVIHRYRAIGDLVALQLAYEALETIVTRTEVVSKTDTDRARTLVAQYSTLSSRDCLHVAVMQRMHCERVWTFDSGFDLIPSLVRVH